MDGWGALTMLMKRQNSDKHRKSKLRYDHQKRRENALSAYTDDSLIFPEVSKKEMEIIKKDIHKKLRKQRLFNFFSYIMAIALIAAFLALVFLLN
jgi:hypothetical protein